MSLPNQLTVLRIFLSPVFVFLLLAGGARNTQLAAIVFIIASMTDWYDGHIARKYGYVTRWGKFLDPLADKILTSSAFMSFVVLQHMKLWMVGVIIGRDVMITALRSMAMLVDRPMQTSNIAKWKTTSQMALIILILLYINFERTGLTDDARIPLPALINIASLFVTLFTALTGLLYLFENRQVIKYIAWRFYRAFIPSDL